MKKRIKTLGPLALCLTVTLVILMLQSTGIAIAEIKAADDTQAFIDALWAKQTKDGHINFWTIQERYEFEQPWVDYILSDEADWGG